MSDTSRPPRKRPLHASYDALAQALPLRPFRSETEYDEATEVLQRLVIGEATLDEGEKDYLETLELLIGSYESLHYPPEQVNDPLGALKFLMTQNGITTSALGALLGSKGTASEILRGKKLISRANAYKLAARFSVEPGLFFQPPPRGAPNRRDGHRSRRRRIVATASARGA